MKTKALVMFVVATLLLASGGCGVVGTAYDMLQDESSVDVLPSPTLRKPSPMPVTETVTPVPTATLRPTVVPVVDEDVAALALQNTLQGIYEMAGPSVVNITSRVIALDMFNQPVPQQGSGSGFLYDEQGHIVTNYHVVKDATSVSVTLADGRVFDAQVIGEDPSTDLAVIKIEGADLPESLALADSEEVRVGSFAAAIGNPFGLEQTLTFGVVSSLGRVIESPDGSFIGEAIQTDAPVNPGNSGGPLIDLAGRVIGVNSQIISPSGASAGIGFAVSSNTVRRVVPALITNGKYPHPWLGISGISLSPELVAFLRNNGIEPGVEEGFMLYDVEPGGPADRAGLEGGDRVVAIGNARMPIGGDIITALDDTLISTGRDLTLFLDTQVVIGDQVEIAFVRDGEPRNSLAELTVRPE